jgi:hypothetical protein
MSATKNSAAFHDMMEANRREDDTSHEQYLEQQYLEQQTTNDPPADYDPLEFDLMAPARVASDVLERGTMDPLTAFVFLKQMADEVEAALSRIKEAAVAEARKYGSEGHDVNGVKVQAKAGAGRWDFSGCQEWQLEKERLREVEDRLKAAHAAAQNGLLTATQDGEAVELPRYMAGAETIYCKKVK